MAGKFVLLLGILAVVLQDALGAVESIETKMRNDQELSQFYQLLEASEYAKLSLEFKQITIFAPINAAFQKLGNHKYNRSNWVSYHMTSIPKKTDQLGSSFSSLYSELEGSPPLWITHISGTYHDDIFVNNARILVSQSNIQSTLNGKEQILHKIDEVLIPTTSPETAATRYYNPTAWEFLEKYESFIQQDSQDYSHRVRNFRQRIQQTKKQDIFNNEGGHTFFVPVDEGFAHNRAMMVDEKIIDGHVIPKQVLFTTPTKKDLPYQTLANSDNIRVVILFTQEKRGATVANYVKSHTIVGDGKHTKGVVLAEIVRANIPVKNGVIHLIHKPLMVVDSTVQNLLKVHQDYICNLGNTARKDIKEPEYLYTEYGNEFVLGNPPHRPIIPVEKDDGILNSFLNAINDLGPSGESFLRTLENSQDITLFAPCNKALEGDLTLNSILSDKNKFLDILKMHLVVDNRLYVENVLKNSLNKVYQAPTMSKGKNLYFNVMTVGNNRTMTVEGGGVNATVIQADLAATNGIIHIIDRVLGVPYTTVLEKLRTDPMLNATYYLGNLQGFNAQLNDTTKKFTYFVPRESAWFKASIALPSDIKKLFMFEYAYHATATLERHLVISDQIFTMEKIKQLSNDSNTYGTFGQRREVELPAVRGSLKIYVEEHQDNTFTIFWRGEKIPVFRPNVECTNGIIHVIDKPFLQQGDIRVNSAPMTWKMALPQLLVVVLAKWLAL